MKLFEYEAKHIIAKYGIAIPKGVLVDKHNLDKIELEKLNLSLVLKSQILISGRQKAGGVLFAKSFEQTRNYLKKLIATKIKNEKIDKVLIEEKIECIKELYLSITIDRNQRSYVAIASEKGGIDIEQTSIQFPQKIIKLLINSQQGFNLSEARKVTSKLGYTGTRSNSLANILITLFQIVKDYDIELIELNPLAETKQENFVALDSRIILDDNSLFRHPEYKKKSFEIGRELGVKEIEAKKLGLVYVKLEGDIGVIGNGAGLVLSTLDMIKYYGGKSANFLDLGGGASIKKISYAMEIVLTDPNVKVLFVNIIGGLTSCDDVAAAIIKTLVKTKTKKPIISRLIGTNEKKGRKLLKEKEIEVLDNMEEAAIKAVKLSRKLS